MSLLNKNINALKYLDFFPSFKVVLELSDHGHVRSWLGEVRLGQVSLGLIIEFKGPI